MNAYKLLQTNGLCKVSILTFSSFLLCELLFFIIFLKKADILFKLFAFITFPILSKLTFFKSLINPSKELELGSKRERDNSLR
jgi:hypothetical protein